MVLAVKDWKGRPVAVSRVEPAWAGGNSGGAPLDVSQGLIKGCAGESPRLAVLSTGVSEW